MCPIKANFSPCQARPVKMRPGHYSDHHFECHFQWFAVYTTAIVSLLAPLAETGHRAE
jgi:hypothetical protein